MSTQPASNQSLSKDTKAVLLAIATAVIAVIGVISGIVKSDSEQLRADMREVRADMREIRANMHEIRNALVQHISEHARMPKENFSDSSVPPAEAMGLDNLNAGSSQTTSSNHEDVVIAASEELCSLDCLFNYQFC